MDEEGEGGAEGRGLPPTLQPHQGTSTHKAGSASSSEFKFLVNKHVFRATEMGWYENIPWEG